MKQANQVLTSESVRRLLVEALRLDLVGPDNGHAFARELLPEPPSRWYLTGFLVPSGAPVEERTDPTADEELESAGEGGGTDDAQTPDNGPARRGILPSSMGLSVLVGPEVKELRAQVCWGDYVFEGDGEEGGDGGEVQEGEGPAATAEPEDRGPQGIAQGGWEEPSRRVLSWPRAAHGGRCASRQGWAPGGADVSPGGMEGESMGSSRRSGRGGTAQAWRLVAGALALACGCTTYHHEVGSTHVAVLSVTPWEEYAEQLAPGFEVNANTLRTEAVADSLQFEETLQHAFSGGLGLALTGGGGAATSPTSPADSAATAGTPPQLGTLQLPGSAINRAALGGDRFLEYQAATALYQEVKLLNRYVLDPATRQGYGAHIVRLQVTSMPRQRDRPFDTYANLAFFMGPVTQPAWVGAGQSAEGALTRKAIEVAARALAARERDMENAERAVKRREEAYRQLAAKPKPTTQAEQLLWAQGIKQVQDALDAERESLMQAQAEAPDLRAELQFLNAALEAEGAAGAGMPTARRLPVVVPLLVTDQVEAALVSRRLEVLRQLTLSLAAAYASQGAKLDIEDLDRKMRSALGRDYNSLFTVARLADNALRVRIGARQVLPLHGREPGYETVPQTHNVTLLLLVPQDDAATDADAPGANAATGIPVYLGLKTEYRDPRDGTPFMVEDLTPRSRDARVRSLLQFGGYKELPEQLGASMDTARVTALAQNGQYQEFMDELGVSDSEPLACGEANRLWLDLICAHVGSDYDVTEFTVPRGKYVSPEPSFPTTDAFLLDDGQSTTATVDGVRNLDVSLVFGTWEWWGVGGTPEASAKHHKLAASAARLNGRRQLVLTFPSLLKSGLVRPGQDVQGQLHLSQGDAGASVTANVTLAKAPDPNHVEVLATTDTVALKDGVGQVELLVVARGPAVEKVAKAEAGQLASLAEKKEGFLLTVSGAEADTVSGQGTPATTLRQLPAGFAYLIAGTGKVTFSIRNPGGAGKVSFKVAPPVGSDLVQPLELKTSAPTGAAKDPKTPAGE